jgi:tRNA1Val (adenine37-N6)-methyltransferase
MSEFYFKQFSLSQDLTAMKVGTDSVLLGAWLKVEMKYNSILDIGTGTGILALMLAQKKSDAHIVGLEIDESAYKDALHNSEKCPWSNRLVMHHVDAKDWESEPVFDLIVSNPPYFKDAILSDESNKAKARHQLTLSLENLIQIWERCGNTNSDMACILPTESSAEMMEMVKNKKYHLKNYLAVKSRREKPVKRVLLHFSKKPCESSRKQLTIFSSADIYSKEFTELTKDFYLDF